MLHYDHGLSWCSVHCGGQAEKNELPDVRDMALPLLVQEYADLKVWFVVHEVTGRVPEGNAKHQRLCAVVMELRGRGALV